MTSRNHRLKRAKFVFNIAIAMESCPLVANVGKDHIPNLPTGWSRSSAAMKFSLVAALVVVLAVAHGSEAGSLVKRDVQAEVDKITKLIRDMSATFTRETQDIVEKVKALEVTNSAQTYMEASKAQIQPLVDKVQAEATRMQEQLKPFLANIEDQLKPLGDNVNVHVKPLTDMMASFFQQVVDQTKYLLPPQ
ncbi:hypothetical protein F2P81_016314 [Scophthalmus maximus]|uniref:Type-4 ice-structuring protein LS-12-like n=1 Tax=Scophthalmus maximus TaxID=52904 RepID=A0A6A4SGX3_SCOMX|nr:hypothetical protein F2P81_016314 [Scophthalmus maximus]